MQALEGMWIDRISYMLLVGVKIVIIITLEEQFGITLKIKYSHVI